MRTLLLFASLVLGSNYSGYACSACGCSASNQSIGLLSQIPYNFIGLQYQLRGFNTTHPDDGGSDLPGISREYYQTFQLTGKYAISKRVQIMAFVPYVVNIRKQDNVLPLSMAGMGDATIVANVYAIKKMNCTWNHNLLIGGGVKMPTGKFDRQSTKTEEGLPNMQPGTHSWDFIANGSYTVAHKALGLNVDANYTVTTANSDSYKYGNRFSTNSFVYYKLVKDGFTILPQLGVSYDHNEKDYENYADRQIDHDSGSWQLYAAAGLQAMYKHLGMLLKYQLPVGQHYNSELVNNSYKTETGIFLVF